MRYIDIKINDNYIQDIEYKELIGGSYKNDFCHFSFDKEWEEFKDKFAVFVTENGSYKKALIDNECDIPLEIFNEKCRFGIGVYGILVKGQDNLIKRNSTNLVYIRCNEGAYKEDLKEIEAVENESIYEQYISKMNEIYSKIKQEHEDIIEVIDNKEIAVKRNIDEYAIEKVKEYNENAIQKIEDYNTNAKVKKEEIDAVAEEVKKDRTYIEEIEKRVKISESNAKTSETNASTSEQNAQNSAENASKVLSDVTGIQEGINASKTHIDDQKVKVDKSVEDVEKLVDEATSQANISKAQAEISTSNASQTSTDKTAVENIKNEVSKIKTSVEKTKTDTEKIKTDTQAIYNDTVQAKNETLEAKTEVESSLENERNESDKRYARAIESEEIVVNGSGQVELDEEGFMKDFSAEGNLPDITQEIREGYNLLNILGLKEAGTVETKKNITYTVLKDGRIEVNGTSTEYVSFNLGTVELEPGTYYSSGNHSNIFIQGIGDFNFSNNQTFTLNERGKTILYLVVLENSGNIDKEIIAPMITSNLANKPYEQYGVSPSLDYPSQFENITRNVNIQNNQRNFLDMSNAKSGTNGGVTVSVNSNGTYGYVGTATQSAINVWFFGSFFNTTPIFILKAGTYYCRDVRIYRFRTTLIGESTAVTLPEDTVITGVRAAQAKVGETYNEIKYPMIVKLEEKDMPYEPYNGYNEQLELSNDQFLGRFQGFENYIENTNLKGNLKIFTLDGTENISKHETLFGNLFRIPFTNYKKNEKILCTHFFGVKNIEERNENTAYLRDDENSSLDIITNLFSTTDEFRTFLSNEYNNNTPVQVLYITNEQYKEDLSTENVTKINSLKVYKGINNIYSNCKIRFKANKNLNKHIESRIKETVANEREISDSKYAIALKIQTEEAQNHQIYADNSKIDNLVIKGGQMTQKTREGYNLFNKDNFVGFNNYYLNISGIIEKANNNYIFILPIKPNTSYTIQKNISNRLRVGFIASDNLENLIGETVINFSIDDAGIQITASSSPESNYLMVQYAAGTDENLDELVNSIQVVEGTEAKQYEQHGSSPSLDHSSEAEVTARIVVDNKQINIVDPNELAIFNSNRYINTKNYTIVPTYYIEPNTEYAVISNIEFGDAGFWGWLNAKSTRLTTRKDSTYDKFVTLFNSGKNTRLSFYVGGFKTDTQGVYQTFTSLYDFFNKTEFMIVKSSFIKNGVLPEYQPHNGYSKEIILPEGQFNNSLGSNYNYIAKINGKWNLVSTIKKLDINYLKNMILGYQDKENFALIVSNLDNVNRDYFFATTPVLCNVLPTLKDVSNETSKEMISIYRHDNSNQLRINVSKTRLDVFEGTNYVDKFKAMLDDMIEKGLNFDIYYPLSEANYEYIELPEETQQVLNSIELMYDLNIISIYNGTMSFEYNKSLARAFEEEKENNAKLQAQIDEIMTLLSTPSTASMLAENLAADNESEVL